MSGGYVYINLPLHTKKESRDDSPKIRNKASQVRVLSVYVHQGASRDFEPRAAYDAPRHPKVYKQQPALAQHNRCAPASCGPARKIKGAEEEVGGCRPTCGRATGCHICCSVIIIIIPSRVCVCVCGPATEG